MSRRKMFTDADFHRIVELSFEGIPARTLAYAFKTSHAHMNAILNTDRAKEITRSLWRAEKMHRALD